MSDVNILKADSRGRITLPGVFRAESLFEYVIDGDQLILYPVRNVRKYPDMSGLPTEELTPEWEEREREVNRNRRGPVSAAGPSRALKRLRTK